MGQSDDEKWTGSVHPYHFGTLSLFLWINNSLHLNITPQCSLQWQLSCWQGKMLTTTTLTATLSELRHCTMQERSHTWRLVCRIVLSDSGHSKAKNSEKILILKKPTNIDLIEATCNEENKWTFIQILIVFTFYVSAPCMTWAEETGPWLFERDHLTWILASDWQRTAETAWQPDNTTIIWLLSELWKTRVKVIQTRS